jgi:glycosyltransferase involved in cell wall biosynthesis
MGRWVEKQKSIPFGISVIIMAFNESESLESVVNEINTELLELNFNKCEIIIVDDGSTDGTGRIADQLAGRYSQVHVIHHDGNKGLGFVYRTGLFNAENDFITFYSADGQFPASNIKRFIPFMKDSDLILGYLPNRKSSIFARFLSKAEKFLFRLAFGKLPKFQGLFLLRRNVLNEIELKSHGRAWAIVMELIIRLSRGGYRIISIPTEMRPRISGKSKVNNLKTILCSLKQLISLYRHME